MVIRLRRLSAKSCSRADDWHFDIQHIGAQVRWLRQVVTNKTLVIAYLEARTKEAVSMAQDAQ